MTRKSVVKVISFLLISSGVSFLTVVGLPIAKHLAFASPELVQTELISPVSLEQTVFNEIEEASSTPSPLTEQDFINPSTRFTDETVPKLDQIAEVQEYLISIPRVNIVDAKVTLGGEDLSQSLIHYPGTAIPGQAGSPVIFGHSVLRQFYNPAQTNPKRYMSIFSKIMTLKNGDEIIVSYDNVEYKYSVSDKFQVKPEDIYILQQKYNAYQLKLVTCVPEGTYLYRGVVVADLQEVVSARSL